MASATGERAARSQVPRAVGVAGQRVEAQFREFTHDCLASSVPDPREADHAARTPAVLVAPGRLGQASLAPSRTAAIIVQ